MTFSIAAAPDGMRIGIAAGVGGSSQVLLTVAPKMWREGPRRSLSFRDWPTGHAELTLYETDRVHIAEPSRDAEEMFAAVLRQCRDSAGSGDNPWTGALLTPDVAPSVPSFEKWSRGPLARAETADLLRLFQRVKLLINPDQRLSARSTRSPILRPLTSRQLLDEVEACLAQARRGYRHVRETRMTIRGRVDAASVARYATTGVPQLRCVYEELTESTILLGIICTALEDIAEGRGARSVLPAPAFDEISLRHDAVRLRRALDEVTALPVREALTAGRQLRLSRLDQPWSDALRLALVIASGRELLAGRADNKQFPATELSAETDRVWEWIVNAALTRSNFDRVVEQGPAQTGLTADPWRKHPISVITRSASAPDNIAFTGRSVFIVDAKYKTAAGAPARDDQYQMFAYTHLVRAEGREVRAAVLVYPGAPRMSEWVRGRDPLGDAVRLFMVWLPFPRSVDLASNRAWDNYLARCGSLLNSSLGLVRADTAAS